jgi:hypothetical protein
MSVVCLSPLPKELLGGFAAFVRAMLRSKGQNHALSAEEVTALLEAGWLEEGRTREGQFCRGLPEGVLACAEEWYPLLGLGALRRDANGAIIRPTPLRHGAQLLWEDQVVKHFRHDASSQLRLLALWEEADWPCSISYTPPTGHKVLKRRRRDLARRLNEGQEGLVRIHFFIDRDGLFAWEVKA